MSVSYAVGIKIGRKADQMTVEAEDALIAALKVRALTPRPLSPTCASRTPAAIGAIRMPARSRQSRQSRSRIPGLRQRSRHRAPVEVASRRLAVTFVSA